MCHIQDPLPQLANQAGWFTAEMGRQPWVVYGLLRTSDALSQAVKAGEVLFSLILFIIVYAGLFVLFIFLLNRKIQHGPDWVGEEMHSAMHKDMALHFGRAGEAAQDAAQDAAGNAAAAAKGGTT